jgi:hypothetical protein
MLRVKVRILDHSPALELLVDEGGAVAGAAGAPIKLEWVGKYDQRTAGY